MNNCICWFSRIFLLGIVSFKGLTARRIYKSFGVKGLKPVHTIHDMIRSRGCDTFNLITFFLACTNEVMIFVQKLSVTKYQKHEYLSTGLRKQRLTYLM
jgi:hypothetical protein